MIVTKKHDGQRCLIHDLKQDNKENWAKNYFDKSIKK